MKRRDYLIGGSALAAVIGGVGVGTGADNLLSGDGGAVPPTMTAQGVFSYGTDGLDRVFWRSRGDERGVNMVFDYLDPAPTYVRLTAPTGKREYVDESPTDGGEAVREFNVPFGRRGTWTVTAEYDGTYTTFDLPLNPSLSWGNHGLDQNTLVVMGSNATHTPNWVESIAVLAGNRTTSYDIGHRLLPGDGFSFQTGYPFNIYTDVTLKLYDGVETYAVTADFV